MIAEFIKNEISASKRLMFGISLIMVFLLHTYLAIGNDSLKLADGFFYNGQYKKAAKHYLDALNASNFKAELFYRIGLCHFLTQSEDYKKYWLELKSLNRGFLIDRIYLVPSDSMAPTLIKGDHIIIESEFYKHKKVQVGDVLAFLNPTEPDFAHLSRVIGLPNDKIEIVNKKVFINDKELFDKYASHGDKKIIDKDISKRDNFGPQIVTDKSYFVLGDNRDFSLDSRFIGFIKDDHIIGKALVIYFSAPDRNSINNARFERIGLLIQ